jgi:molybdate transport system substrate-binding protein
MQSGPPRELGRWPAHTSSGMGRRRLVHMVPAAALLALVPPAFAPRARAATSGADLVLACDITLGPAMRALAGAYVAATGERIDVFPTAAGLIVPQLERDVQNDIVVTQAARMDAAVQAGVVARDAVRGAWRDSLVIAAKRGAPSMPDRPIAISDHLPAADMDSRAVLAQLQLLPTAMLGVIDTDTVVALVLDGTARAGLLHMTDVRAHPELEVIRVVPDDIQPPIVYSAAVTRLARRPDPADFVDFLLSARATALLASLGLETPLS